MIRQNSCKSVPPPDFPVRSKGLRGDLEVFGLPAILTLIEFERKSGELVVLSGPAATPACPDGGRGVESARFLVRGGHIVDAVLRGPKPLKGLAAIFHVLFWSAGRFRFFGCTVAVEDGIGISTARLLMEGARRFDEAGVHAQAQPEGRIQKPGARTQLQRVAARPTN